MKRRPKNNDKDTSGKHRNVQLQGSAEMPGPSDVMECCKKDLHEGIDRSRQSFALSVVIPKHTKPQSRSQVVLTSAGPPST